MFRGTAIKGGNCAWPRLASVRAEIVFNGFIFLDVQK
jgi:hypothetical protein